MRQPTDDIRNQATVALRRAAARLNDARQAKLAESLDKLVIDVDQPCVIAVVGRMKAGKSSFLNALLGEDLAKVGVNETTATINRFVYGIPEADRPVRCYWQDGRVTSESRDFLDGLQGNDELTIRKAMDISFLEYLLPNERLRDTVLVDTPGMCTTVTEHRNRTAEFLQLARQLGDENTKRTHNLGSQADAVIYLIGEVGRQTDHAFLDEFREVTGGRSSALNAVGVMAKIDLHPELISRRQELSEKVGRQLKDSLNTVVPVSAGIRRALDRMDAMELPSIETYVSRIRKIAPQRLAKLLSNEEFYRTLESDDCPVSVGDRQQLLADMPWRVFTTIASVASNPEVEVVAVRTNLDEIAGFDQLLEVLDRNFFRRSRFMHVFHTIEKAIAIVEQLRYQPAQDALRRDREMAGRRERFLKFVENASKLDPECAKDLTAFLEVHGPRSNHESRLRAAYADSASELAALRADLREVDEDFQALTFLESCGEHFTPAERDELRILLGMYGHETTRRSGGRDIQQIGQRQRHWRKAIQPFQPQECRLVAERAVTRYGLLLAELSQPDVK